MAPASPAIVLGLGANGYGIVRSLARAGVPALGVFTRPEEFGRLSRYCESVRVPAGALVDGDLFVETLLRLAQRFAAPPTIFATDDRHAVLLAHHRAALQGRVHFHAAPLDCIETVVDKARMSHRCQEAGILVPRTHVTAPGEDIARSAAGFPFPCVVKPARSFDAAVPAGFKTYTAASPEALLALYARHPALLGASIWQEIVEGPDDAIFQFTTLVRAGGDVRDFACVRKIHQYPPGFGITSLGRTEANPAIVAPSHRLLAALGYRGLASLEFKYQAKNGRYYFIELNPRLPWYNGLFADAGVNLAHLAYLDLLGIDPPPPAGQRDGVHWVSVKEDLGWFLRTRRTGRAGLWHWLRSLSRARSFAWWTLADPVPALRAGLHLLGQAFHRSTPPPPAGSRTVSAALTPTARGA